MALDDRFSDVHELPAVVLGVTPEHLERLVCIDRMAGHEDPLRLLDRRAAAEALRVWSAKRCDVISIALCSSWESPSTM